MKLSRLTTITRAVSDMTAHRGKGDLSFNSIYRRVQQYSVQWDGGRVTLDEFNEVMSTPLWQLISKADDDQGA